MGDPAPCRPADDGLLVFVRVTPKAAGDRIDGLWHGDDGRMAVKIRVRAAPEKGAANKAVATFVAKALGRAKSDAAVVAGGKDRLKTLLVRGDTAALRTALDALVAKAGSD